MGTVFGPGLERVFSDWGGAGSLVTALASAEAESSNRAWTPAEIRGRALRVFLAEHFHLVSGLPQTQREWLQCLPPVTIKQTQWSSEIRGRVNWRKTAVRNWPPQEVYVERKNRGADTVLLSVIAWLGTSLKSVQEDDDLQPKDSVDSTILKAVTAILDTTEAFENADNSSPTESEIVALRHLGGPWKTVSALALALLDFERHGGLHYASRLIQPDIADRVFQLEVLGLCVDALEACTGQTFVSLRPVGGGTGVGPVYASEDWQVWWEASGIWDSISASNVRRELSRRAFSTVDGAQYGARFDRPDIVLVGPGRRILVVECKYPLATGDAGYISTGLAQAYFYASQMIQNSDLVQAVSIGPSDIVTGLVVERLRGISVALGSERDVSELVSNFAAA